MKTNNAFLQVTGVCVLLVLATVISWQLGHGKMFSDEQLTSVFILLISVIKIRFVILDFMEVRSAPLPLRIGVDLWCISAFLLMAAVVVGALSF